MEERGGERKRKREKENARYDTNKMKQAEIERERQKRKKKVFFTVVITGLLAMFILAKHSGNKK